MSTYRLTIFQKNQDKVLVTSIHRGRIGLILNGDKHLKRLKLECPSDRTWRRIIETGTSLHFPYIQVEEIEEPENNVMEKLVEFEEFIENVRRAHKKFPVITETKLFSRDLFDDFYLKLGSGKLPPFIDNTSRIYFQFLRRTNYESIRNKVTDGWIQKEDLYSEYEKWCKDKLIDAEPEHRSRFDIIYPVGPQGYLLV